MIAGRIKDWWRGRGRRAQAHAEWRNQVAGWCNDFGADYPLLSARRGRSVHVALDRQAQCWQHPWQIYVQRSGADWQYRVLPGRVYVAAIAAYPAGFVNVDSYATTWQEITEATQYVWLHIAIVEGAGPGAQTLTAWLTLEASATAYPYWQHPATAGPVTEHILVGDVTLNSEPGPSVNQYLRAHVWREIGLNLADESSAEYTLPGGAALRVRVLAGGVESWARLDLRIDHGRVVVFGLSPEPASSSSGSSSDSGSGSDSGSTSGSESGSASGSDSGSTSGSGSDSGSTSGSGSDSGSASGSGSDSGSTSGSGSGSAGGSDSGSASGSSSSGENPPRCYLVQRFAGPDCESLELWETFCLPGDQLLPIPWDECVDSGETPTRWILNTKTDVGAAVWNPTAGAWQCSCA